MYCRLRSLALSLARRASAKVGWPWRSASRAVSSLTSALCHSGHPTSPERRSFCPACDSARRGVSVVEFTERTQSWARVLRATDASKSCSVRVSAINRVAHTPLRSFDPVRQPAGSHPPDLQPAVARTCATTKGGETGSWVHLRSRLIQTVVPSRSHVSPEQSHAQHSHVV